MRAYKEQCRRCKKNMVLINRRNQYPICLECEMKALKQEVTDPKMKKMFDIPEEIYERNYFLRDVKSKYLTFGSLSEKQIEVFKRVAKEEMEK